MVDRGYQIGGWRSTGEVRLRPTLFGLRAEELYQHRSGAAQWRRCARPILIEPRNPYLHIAATRPEPSPPITKG